MVVKTVYAGSGSGSIVTKVTEVKGGIVHHTEIGDVTATTKGDVKELNVFGYDSLMVIKARAEASEGKCTVTVDGHRYAINGELGTATAKTIYDLVIILDKNEAGGLPTKVDGEYGLIMAASPWK